MGNLQRASILLFRHGTGKPDLDSSLMSLISPPDLRPSSATGTFLERSIDGNAKSRYQNPQDQRTGPNVRITVFKRHSTVIVEPIEGSLQTPSVGVVRPVEAGNYYVISIPESRPAQYTDSGETSGAIRSPSSLLSVPLSHPFTTRTHAHLSLAPHIAKVLLNLLRHSAATRVQAPSW